MLFRSDLRVTAVASVGSGGRVDREAIRESLHDTIDAFKMPKQIFIVEKVERAPSGKADYKWARKTVEEALR